MKLDAITGKFNYINDKDIDIVDELFLERINTKAEVFFNYYNILREHEYTGDELMGLAVEVAEDEGFDITEDTRAEPEKDELLGIAIH